jgi:hypothetical protein
MTRLLFIWLLCLAWTLPTRAAEENWPAKLEGELARMEKGPVTVASRVQELRLYFYLGTRSSDEKVRRAYFEKGDKLGKEVLDLHPEDPGALFWWGGNAGNLAALKRNLSSLSTIREVRDALLKLKKVDPDYGFAGWARALGVLYHRAPGFISIGSDSKAEDCLREAVRRFPEFPGNRLALAEFLFDKDKFKEARALANQVKESESFQKITSAEFAPEKPDWEATIERLLKPDAGSR